MNILIVVVVPMGAKSYRLPQKYVPDLMTNDLLFLRVWGNLSSGMSVCSICLQIYICVRFPEIGPKF